MFVYTLGYLAEGWAYSGYSATSLAHPAASKVKSTTFFDRYVGPVQRHALRLAFTIVEHQGDGAGVVVGIIQGKGNKKCAEASQPVVFREWIDRILAQFGAKAKWLAVDYR